jgi:hypothetical protein
MASEERFQKGQCYFLLGYYDRQFRFPYIQTFVYIGKNLESAGRTQLEDRWYFQSPQFFLERGATPLQDFSEDSGIMTATQEALDGFVDSQGLISELTERAAGVAS